MDAAHIEHWKNGVPVKINLTLPEDGGTVKVSKTSGSVTAERECSFNNNTYKFGTGAAEISVSMTSGKLLIK